MYTQKIDSAIISKVIALNKNQKSDVLDYLQNMPRHTHNTRLYKRKALKQIRKALQEF